MASFGRPFSTASPVLAMPPRPAHQTSPSMAPLAAPAQASAAPNASVALPDLGHTPTSLRSAGRKRSRDEAAPNLVDETPMPLPAPEPASRADDDWEYGEGMVLIRRNRGYVTDASSQSGTWLEEKTSQEQVHRAAAAAAAHVQSLERPLLRSNKSQRLDQVAPPLSGSEGGPPITMNDVHPATPPAMSCPPPGGSGEPVVDHFTLHLGIGWRRISDDEHIQAAARGWAKFIENHYPLSSVNIRLESRGLQAYLIEATEGFYLFAEDLRQGRLVSTNVEGALENLKTSPPVFQGQDTLVATESPGAGPTSGLAQALQSPNVEMELA